MKYFIDFASDMGWEYQLVDWYWYGAPFVEPIDWNNPISNPDADITTMNPNINIPELVEYAAGKNVKLLLWLEWHHADKQMEEAFPLYEKWGIVGVKVDFMARDDQEMVKFYHRVVKLAAGHHLLVNFHGAYKPTGFSRTYPNLITREGVMGNEYNKWSANITPEHKVTLPFTRGLLGEMDFTPGSFINVTVDNFRTEGAGIPPVSMGTRCNQLALMVVYESALQVLCDSPFNYRNSPEGLDFISAVPTTWDETKVINAEIGNLITIARKSGDEWFVGSMTDSEPRVLDIPLAFLNQNISYLAKIWRDGGDADVNPGSVKIEEINVDNHSVIKAELASGGGHVMRIIPTTNK
jgi:alpha-glucosidase